MLTNKKIHKQENIRRREASILEVFLNNYKSFNTGKKRLVSEDALKHLIKIANKPTKVHLTGCGKYAGYLIDWEGNKIMLSRKEMEEHNKKVWGMLF